MALDLGIGQHVRRFRSAHRSLLGPPTRLIFGAKRRKMQALVGDPLFDAGYSPVLQGPLRSLLAEVEVVVGEVTVDGGVCLEPGERGSSGSVQVALGFYRIPSLILA